MMTVGYGDIKAINTTERMYVMVMSLFSCGMFGFTINKMGNLFNAKKEEEF